MGKMYQLTIDEGIVTMTILEPAEDPQDDPVAVGSIRMTKEKARKLGAHLIDISEAMQ